MKALVIMIIRRLDTSYALLAFLDQDDAVAARLRPLWCAHGRFPSRRTWERRLATLPPSLPGVIGYCGRHLGVLLTLWAMHAHAVAGDSPPLASGGGVWHNKHREQGMIPHWSIDIQAGLRRCRWQIRSIWCAMSAMP